MGKINVLDFEIANLIAAGEVVDRPASVVKELLENAIDSGADKISVEIKNGGISLIRVTDNGCGMSAEDLPVAIKRHATSKISKREDLAAISTLGFRGEALAAIASVSEMTIISKIASSPSAHMLSVSGGRVTDFCEVGSSDGTSVIVENLFENIPARKKFLKKDSTEAMAISAIVEKVAMSRSDISFSLIIDGNEKYMTVGEGNLLHTLYSLLGRDFASKMIEVSGDTGAILVTGYVGRSDNVRGNRNYQNVFINGRYVKSKTVTAALEKAYTSYIAPEKFPVCALFIKINPAFVDVNVHPAKLEVRFSDERAVFEAVYYTVKSSLENAEYRPEANLSPQKRQMLSNSFVPIGGGAKSEQIKLSGDSFSENEGRKNIPPPSYRASDVASSLRVNSSFHDSQYVQKSAGSIPPYIKTSSRNDTLSSLRTGTAFKDYMSAGESAEIIKHMVDVAKISDMTVGVGEDVSEPKKASNEDYEYRFIGEIYNCYVLIEFKNEILIIDKHAAHERIIFEDLKRNEKNDGRIGAQSLLVPITLLLTPEEINAAREHADEISSLGFSFVTDEKNVSLTAVPDATAITDAGDFFVRILDEIVSGTGEPGITEQSRREKALYQIACKAAVKGGRVYDRSTLEWIVRRILAMPDITVCPHGRPVAIKLTKNELDRQFDRIK